MKTIRNRALLRVLCSPNDHSLEVTNPATGKFSGMFPQSGVRSILFWKGRSHRNNGQRRLLGNGPSSPRPLPVSVQSMANQTIWHLIPAIRRSKASPSAESERSRSCTSCSIVHRVVRRKRGKSVGGQTIPPRGRRQKAVWRPIRCSLRWRGRRDNALEPSSCRDDPARRLPPWPPVAVGFVERLPSTKLRFPPMPLPSWPIRPEVPRDVLSNWFLITRLLSWVKRSVKGYRVKKLSFTGSTAVGRRLMAQCAPTVKRLSMELKGNVLVVLDDASTLRAAGCGGRRLKIP